MGLGEPTSTSRMRTEKRYAEDCDKYLAEAGETRTVEQAEKTFWKAVKKASGLLTPAGRIRHFQQTLMASAKLFADERERKRRQNPADEKLNDLNTDQITGGCGRQANQMAIRRRQIRPSNRHIASMSAC